MKLYFFCLPLVADPLDLVMMNKKRSEIVDNIEVFGVFFFFKPKENKTLVSNPQTKRELVENVTQLFLLTTLCVFSSAFARC